jgi:hypothetical protein
MIQMKYVPVVQSNNEIRLGLYKIDIKMIRCISEAKEIVSYWKQLDMQGFPMDDITSTLTALEAFQYIKNKEYSVLPFPIHIIRLVDAIKVCTAINGSDKRKNDLKESLLNIVKDIRRGFVEAEGTIDFAAYQKYVNELMKAILSSISEFRIAYALKLLDSSVEFTSIQKGTKYPDLRIRDFDTVITNTTLAEVKTRLNRSYVGEEIVNIFSNDRTIRIDKNGLIRLLCRDAFTTFENAFERQGAYIALIDLSHSEFGDIFAAYSMRLVDKFDLKSALEEALQLARNRKKAVILYTEVFALVPQNNPCIAATAIGRDYAEDLGRSLDKIEKDYYNQNKRRLDYFELIDKAQRDEIH